MKMKKKNYLSTRSAGKALKRCNRCQGNMLYNKKSNLYTCLRPGCGNAVGGAK